MYFERAGRWANRITVSGLVLRPGPHDKIQECSIMRQVLDHVHNDALPILRAIRVFYQTAVLLLAWIKYTYYITLMCSLGALLAHAVRERLGRPYARQSASWLHSSNK